MLRYIVSNKNIDDNDILFEFDITYTLTDESIAATLNTDTDPDFLDKEIGDMIDDEYNNFIDRVRIYILQCGFYELKYEESDRGSKSRYIDFCPETEFDDRHIKCVFHLRISDHRLKKRKGVKKSKPGKKDDRKDRSVAEDKFLNDSVQEYIAYNDTDDPIDYAKIEVFVSGQKFATYGDAMNHIKRRLKEEIGVG